MRDRGEAIVRICFDAEPREDDLELLGSRERWLLYRSLVRNRLFKLAHTAFPRTLAAMSVGAFDAIVAAWLAAGPPRTRYFFLVPLELGTFALEQMPEAPAHVADLLRYEIVCWRVRQKAVTMPEAAEFSFDRPPVLHPTLEVVSLGHPVHLVAPGAAEAEKPTRLCVYRNRSEVAEALSLNPLAHALLEDWLAGERTVAESVRRVTSARGTAIDQRFVETLGALIADLLERGVLLGSRV